MRAPRMAAAMVAIAALTALAGCTAGGDRDGPSASPSRRATPAPGSGELLPSGAPKDVVTGLEAPWSVVLAGTTPLISERDSGDILELDGGTARRVGTVAGVSHGGEGGLLGLALDDRRRLFVYSTGEDGNRIQRYPLDGRAGSYRLGDPTTVLDGLPKNSFHDGGRLAIGPDGMLYASVGDTGDRESAQDRKALTGKILRMTPDGDVPSDNPFPGSLVYSYGHRNVQGLGWAADGTMFAAEFGQDTWDELNVIRPGGDYGWPEVEGRGGGSRYIDPVQEWRTADASPSGLAVIGGTIFIANLRGERVRAIPVADPSTAREYWTGEFGRIRTVLRGPDDRLWFVTNNRDGRGSPRDGDDRILSVALSAG